VPGVSDVFGEDIERAAAAPEVPWELLSDATAVVTGATGLVGGALARVLAAAGAGRATGLRVVGHGRDLGKGAALARDCGAEFFASDIREPLGVQVDRDKPLYVFHCAATTASSAMVSSPVELMASAALGTANVLDWAWRNGAACFVYLSSMEVYGRVGSEQAREQDLGYLDLRRARSSYPESKRFCECLCACYLASRGLATKVARLALTFGAGSPQGGGVCAQFARSAAAGEDVVLHTEGASMWNYCYIADAVKGLALIALRGEPGGVYNVANPDMSMTIREMAEVAARCSVGGKSRAVVRAPDDIAERGYLTDLGYKLDAGKLMALGWRPAYGMEDMFRRAIADWAAADEGQAAREE
jgi:nucleoside-diphosphate-sugar epimerase